MKVSRKQAVVIIAFFPCKPKRIIFVLKHDPNNIVCPNLHALDNTHSTNRVFCYCMGIKTQVLNISVKKYSDNPLGYS